MPRKTSGKDQKILFGKSASYCSHSDCDKPGISEETDLDPPVVLGEMCHIYGHSEGGPRFNPDLPPEERDCYDNLILLCGYHHKLVDKQPNTYTAEVLIEWKKQHERWVKERIEIGIQEVTFEELGLVTKGILQSPALPSTDFVAIDPGSKMKKNNLTEEIRFLLTMGLAKAKEVENFVMSMAKLYPDFPERLKSGFVEEYNKLRSQGFEGDSLFMALREFAGMRSNDFKIQAAGLSVLCYLFDKCEVFEK